MTREKYLNVLPFLLIFIVTILAYSNSFHGDFQLDDNHTILNNEKIKDLGNYKSLTEWEPRIYNRKFSELTFALNYGISGYDVFGYHLFNLAIHLLNAFLVYWFVRLLIKHSLAEVSENKKKGIALFSALIFAVHPVQIQAVTYITQRMVSLAVLFYLLGMCSYLTMRYRQIACIKDWGNKVLTVFTVIFFIISSYCKEIAFSFPLAILVLELIIIRKADGTADRKTIGIISLILLASAILFIVRYGLPRQANTIDQYSYFLTELNVLGTYLRLLILPVNLHVYYDQTVYTTLLNTPTIISLFILISLLVIGVIFIKSNRLIAFSIFWFFLTQIIESSVFPLQFLIFEYRLYPSVIGFGIVISYSAYHLFKSKYWAGTVLALIVIILGILTFADNEKWKSIKALWSDNIIKAPMHPKPYNYLGTNYYLNGNSEEAVRCFTKSIELDSNYAEPYAHRGLIYKERREYSAAFNDMNKSIRLDGSSPLNYNNRGSLQLAVGEIESAIADFSKAIELYPSNHLALNNLSIAYQRKGDYGKALEFADKAIKINSKEAKYYNNRGNVYYSIDQFGSAKSDYKKAIECNGNYSLAINNLGLVLMNEGKYNEAIEYFTRAIELNGNYFEAYRNREYSLMMMGRSKNEERRSKYQ